MLSDERYQQLMENVGMPDSNSLLQALRQAAMEATLAEREACVVECARLKELYLSQGRTAMEEALLVAATDDCATAICTR